MTSFSLIFPLINFCLFQDLNKIHSSSISNSLSSNNLYTSSSNQFSNINNSKQDLLNSSTNLLGIGWLNDLLALREAVDGAGGAPAAAPPPPRPLRLASPAMAAVGSFASVDRGDRLLQRRLPRKGDLGRHLENKSQRGLTSHV